MRRLRWPRKASRREAATLTRIASVGRAFPPNYYEQEALLAGFERVWGERLFNPERLSQLHRNVLVQGRHLALPIEEYEALESFTKANEAYIHWATELGAAAIADGLTLAGLSPEDVDHLFFVSTTGVATPSIDARLVNRLGLRSDVKRSPIFGLGCLAGVAGVARATDYLAGSPQHTAVLLSVELCSLTLQREDLSIANLIASGLFGDGAAAAVLVGNTKRGMSAGGGPGVVATRSAFYPDTEDVMGWKIGTQGFSVVLSAEVPDVVRAHVENDVDSFLSDHDLSRRDISAWICHPGGPKVLETLGEVLDLPTGTLDRSWRTLAELGNLSSASVLMVLRDVLDSGGAGSGSWGLMLALGPGFCSELALLRW